MTIQERIDAIKALTKLLKTDSFGIPVIHSSVRGAVENKIHALIKGL